MNIKQYMWVKMALYAFVVLAIFLSGTDFQTELYALFGLLTLLEMFIFLLLEVSDKTGRDSNVNK